MPRARALRIAGAVGAGAMVLGLVTVGAAVADSGAGDRASVSQHHKMIRKAGSMDGPGNKKSREAAPKFMDGPGGKKSREAAPKFMDGPGAKKSREAAPTSSD
ncbi:MAG: hypothetical protein ACTHKG_21330 [Nocardioides sp.]